MKARIKKTGEIVNLASYATITLDCCDSWGNPIELKPEEIELIQDKTDDFDWQSFRNQASKDILCATLSGGTASGMIGIIPEKETIVKASIEIADELIKQLKEKEEKCRQ